MGAKSLTLARTFQKAFIENYLNAVSKVRITRDNIADNLLSFVSFSTGEQKQPKTTDQADNEEASKQKRQQQTSIGIATNYKVQKSGGGG